jgi:hypothetical protein
MKTCYKLIPPITAIHMTTTFASILERPSH